MQNPIHYIPLATTAFAAWFAPQLFHRWRTHRPAPHLFWWGLGVALYGAGTLTESLTTLFGWQESIFRLWYITGALLGGAPLAQGTAYLLLSRRTADRLTLGLLTVVAVAASCVALSPIAYANVEPHRLSGAVLAWSWVRGFSPFINSYAFLMLVGGAAVSAWRYRRAGAEARMLANIYIAIGGLLPGIGGAFTRFGHVEVLYVTELIGLLLIFQGYRLAT
ncbi:MAG: hypothetical protein ACHQXA_04420, partial [Gemmatimonadales bacterium]